MSVRVFIILGGLVGWDGPMVSGGMLALAKQLAPFGTISTHNWSDYVSVITAIREVPLGTAVVVIGYSGGGSRATFVAQDPGVQISLMVLYDPSPKYAMQPIKDNVARAICYRNLNPGWPFTWLGIGGGQLVGANVVTENISENHYSVQYDQALHAQTIAAIRALG